MTDSIAQSGNLDLPTRWEVELEFVQSLANIPYLSYLAQNHYLSDPHFINYLEYLQYWSQPNYAKYIVYPNCLHVLQLLTNEEFRRLLVNPDFTGQLMNDMVNRWMGQQETRKGGDLKEGDTLEREDTLEKKKEDIASTTQI